VARYRTTSAQPVESVQPGFDYGRHYLVWAAQSYSGASRRRLRSLYTSRPLLHSSYEQLPATPTKFEFWLRSMDSNRETLRLTPFSAHSEKGQGTACCSSQGRGCGAGSGFVAEWQ
jgi:hypothetical protein